MGGEEWGKGTYFVVGEMVGWHVARAEGEVRDGLRWL